MAFIETIRPDTASGAARDMYDRQENHWGYVPNYAKVFSHRPEVMARWGRLLAEIRRPVDDRRFELVTLAAALQLRHTACSLAHGAALAQMIGKENVIAIANGEYPDVLSEAECALMEFARDIARDATTITRDRVETLKEIHGLSDAEVFDVAAVASGRCFFTKVLDALGSEVDSEFAELDAELRHALTAGRPISDTKPEYATAVASRS